MRSSYGQKYNLLKQTIEGLSENLDLEQVKRALLSLYQLEHEIKQLNNSIDTFPRLKFLNSEVRDAIKKALEVQSQLGTISDELEQLLAPREGEDLVKNYLAGVSSTQSPSPQLPRSSYSLLFLVISYRALMRSLYILINLVKRIPSWEGYYGKFLSGVERILTFWVNLAVVDIIFSEYKLPQLSANCRYSPPSGRASPRVYANSLRSPT